MQGENEDKFINVPFKRNELDALLETLMFARRAALTFSSEEIRKAAGLDAARSFRLIAENAADLYEILTQHLNIGEPENSTIN